MDAEKTGVSPMFDIIALKKDKKKKEASLNDLLQCVTSLADSTSHLRDYGVVSMEAEDREKIDVYLKGLLKIQDGLLEMARRQIAQGGTMDIEPTLSMERISPAGE